MADRDVVSLERSASSETRDGALVARHRLFERLYDELHALAVEKLRREPRDHTLQPSAVVHEVYLRLTDGVPAPHGERTRFLATAARAMHQVLVDHARRRRARKRGGQWRKITLSDGVLPVEDQLVEIVALEQALTKLEVMHERAARIVVLRFFGGLEEREIAQELGVSRTTVQGEWRLARAWLHQELSE